MFRKPAILGRAAASAAQRRGNTIWRVSSRGCSGSGGRVSLGLWASPMRVARSLLAVLLDPALNLGVRYGYDAAHSALEALPRFRAFDIFRLGLH